jgi:hypothetical protein
MAESITHIAICDDSMRVALAAGDDINSTFKQVLAEQRNFARMGSITHGGNSFLTPTLEALRDRWPQDGAASEKDQRKLSYILGALCHRSGDFISKPIYMAVSGGMERPGGPDRDVYLEASIYHEAVSFREVYANGKYEPYAPWVVDAPASEAQAQAQQLIQVMFQQALISFHTFYPRLDNFEEWLDRMLDGYQALYMSIPQYAAIFTHPDPAKVKKYVIKPNFYNPEDPIIKLARDIQTGKKISAADVKTRAKVDKSSSAYARGIDRALAYLRWASAYWTRQIDMDELKKGFELDKKDGGLPGLLSGNAGKPQGWVA